MASRHSSVVALTAMFAGLLVSSQGARAAGEINEQVLQGVGVFNGEAALDMRFDTAPDQRPPDFEKLGIAGFTTLASCQRNATRGLYCIDGAVVRRWTDPEKGLADYPQEFSCANARLKLTGPEYCTALAIAQNGDAWIAGRRKSTSVLIRLREKVAGNCIAPVSQSLGPNERYCFQEFGFARPLLSKLVVVDGDEAAAFDRGTGVAEGGVLGLDIRNAVTYSSLDPNVAPIDLVTKNQWLLSPKESLQDLTLLQTESGVAADPIDNNLLVTTSLGRVLRFQTDANASDPRTGEVFDARGYAAAVAAAQCTVAGSPDRFGVAASNKTGRVFVANRNFCQVAALQPAAAGIRNGGLVNVKEGVDDLTLSTVASATVAYPPDGVTVTPGVAVDLGDCEAGDVTPNGEAGCAVITLKNSSGSEKTILRFSRVQRPSEAAPSRAVVFKIENVPDCRYRLYFAELNGTTDPVCDAFDRSEIIVPAASGNPALPGNQFLNIRAMFPPEVTDQFTGDNELPAQILVSPQYRARKDRDLLFGAIVVVPEPGLVLVDTYDAIFSVGDLLSGVDEGLLRCAPPVSPTLGNLLRFDVVTRASETYLAPGGVHGPADLSYVDSIVNSGCGTTRTRGGTFSVFSYGLEVAYNPGYDPTPGIPAAYRLYDPIVVPPAEPGDPPTLVANGNDDDDVYARLVRKLFDDLGVFQKQIACGANVDAPGSLPLPGCSGLNGDYDNTLDKLGKCLLATQQPKTSALDQNCQAFEIQFGSYQTQVEALPARPDFDPANRIGELKGRLTTIWLLYRERFLPSVPEGGYTP
jgi:hypothetical protein